MLNQVDKAEEWEAIGVGDEEKHVMEKVELFRKSPRKPKARKVN